MKKIFHKILSLSIAFVVLFSTMSFTVNMHYCGNTLVDTAIFHQVKTCGMETQAPSNADECAITKNNCCSDQQIAVEGQDELQLSFNTVSFEQQKIVASFDYIYIALFEGLEKNVSLYEEYKPPLVIRCIYKIDETYLI